MRDASTSTRSSPGTGATGNLPALTALLSLALLLPALSAQAQAQTGSIEGTVLNADTGEPLRGAQVHIPDTSIGALTNDRGEFTLGNVPAGEVQLRVMRIGFGTQTTPVSVTPDAVATVEVRLRQSAVALDQIVVTGTGAPTERRRVGHTLATIDSERLQNLPISSVSEVLQGREPGVDGLPTGGLTGEGSRIRIRGAASLAQSNEPIIYVDGVRMDNTSSMRASRLDDINPAAIERVEILKGAAAATLYGTEASGGVIQIFTKQGHEGPARWEYQLEQGFTRYPSERWAPHAGFARTPEQAAHLSDFWGVPGLQPFEVFEVDLMDQFFETGHSTAHSLSVSGGGSNIQYYIGGRYATEDGPFGGKEWQVPGFKIAEDINDLRQANVNLTLFATDDLRLRVSGRYIDRHYEVPGIGNSIYAPYSMGMMSQLHRATETNPTGAGAFISVREGLQRLNWQDVERFGGNVGANYLILGEIDLDASIGIDVVNQRTIFFRPFGYNVDGIVADDVFGYRSISDRNHQDISFDLRSSWDSRFGQDFTTNVVFGGQFLAGRTHTSGGFGRDFPGPGLQVAEAGATQSVWDEYLNTVNAGLFGQTQIGFRNLAFLTLGARFDRHSAFGEEAGAALYPKVSLSVIPSDLAGWNSRLVSSLQLRSAIGQAGLQPGAFDRFTTFGPLPAETGPGVAPDNVGNPHLRPETSTEWEVGADLGLFDDRFSLEATYWNRSVTDLLVARQFPPSGGFLASQLDNLGGMKAQGLELNLQGTAYASRNFSIRPFVTASYLHQELTDLGGAPDIKVEYFRYLTWHRVGYAPGSFFGPTLADAEYPIDLAGNCQAATRGELLDFLSQPRDPGAIRPLVQGCGTAEQGNQYLGKPMPDWSGAFGADISFFRNFTLTNQFEYKAGNFAVHNLGDAFRRSHSLLGRNIRSAAEIESTLLNPGSTAEERVDAAVRWATEVYALSPYDGLNEVENGDFIRWREAALTYEAPGDFAERFGLRNVAVTLAGRNLALFTGYTGVDPEANVVAGQGSTAQFVEGTNAWVLAMPRRVSLSVRVGF